MNETAIVPNAAPASPEPEARVLYVVFKVDGAEYALRADTVVQMESYSGATPVPGAVPWVAGIMQLRGRVVPVVDLRARFGLPAAPPTADTRVVVGEADGRAVALVADTAREVMRIPPSQVVPPPRLVDDGAGGYVTAVAQVGARTIMVLDFRKLIGDEHG